MSKIVMLVPGEEAYVSESNLSLESMQKIVDGHIEVVYPFADPVALVCNEEGKLINLALNRALRDDDGNVYDIVAGTAFICGLGAEDFTGLTDELAFKYCEMFKMPQTFLNIDGKLFVF